MFHKSSVFRHLFHIAHARENHDNSFKARSVANGIAGRGGRTKGREDLFCFSGNLSQSAAANRLHDSYWFVVFSADLIAFSALNGIVIIIGGMVIMLILKALHMTAFILIQNLAIRMLHIFMVMENVTASN